MENVTPILREIQIFARLTERTLQEIAQALFRRTYAPDAFILMEGEPCQAAFFIAEGTVCVHRLSSDGREQVLVQMKKGEAFNTVPPIPANGKNHANVRALTEATLYGLSKDDYVRLLQTYPDLAYAVLQDLANRMSHMTDLIENLSLHSVRGRLARFLLAQADGNELPQRWTQDEIAAHVGTVRDVVGRTLRAFQDAGFIRRDRQKIILIDRKGLEAEAET